MPGIEPGPSGWKPEILTTRPHRTYLKELKLSYLSCHHGYCCRWNACKIPRIEYSFIEWKWSRQRTTADISRLSNEYFGFIWVVFRASIIKLGDRYKRFDFSLKGNRLIVFQTNNVSETTNKLQCKYVSFLLYSTILDTLPLKQSASVFSSSSLFTLRRYLKTRQYDMAVVSDLRMQYVNIHSYFCESICFLCVMLSHTLKIGNGLQLSCIVYIITWHNTCRLILISTS